MGMSSSKDKPTESKDGQEEVKGRFFGIPNILKQHEYRPIGVIVMGLGMMSAYLLYRTYISPYMLKHNGNYEYLQPDNHQNKNMVIINQRKYSKPTFENLKIMADNPSQPEKEKAPASGESDKLDPISSNLVRPESSSEPKESKESEEMPPLEGEEPTIQTKSNVAMTNEKMGMGDDISQIKKPPMNKLPMNKPPMNEPPMTFHSNVSVKSVKDHKPEVRSEPPVTFHSNVSVKSLQDHKPEVRSEPPVTFHSNVSVKSVQDHKPEVRSETPLAAEVINAISVEAETANYHSSSNHHSHFHNHDHSEQVPEDNGSQHSHHNHSHSEHLLEPSEHSHSEHSYSDRFHSGHSYPGHSHSGHLHSGHLHAGYSHPVHSHSGHMHSIPGHMYFDTFE